MKLSKITILSLTLFVFVLNCKNDDDDSTDVPERDRAEVYAEDLAEIETFLSTHFYNYEDYDSVQEYSDLTTNPFTVSSNDNFTIVIDTIAGANSSKIPLIDQVDFKLVYDNQGVEYKLYYLVVREGLGESLHQLDRAIVSYKGYLSSKQTFDSSPQPTSFNLTALGGTPGVVPGFRDGLVQFKTAQAFTENSSNGSTTYHNHGIGAVFIPSGVGYFSAPVGTIPTYTPIFFNFNLIGRNDTDFDLDNIPSHLEDLNGDGDGFNEDTDIDGLANFFDNDDDGDGVLTRDEDLEDTDLNVDSDGDGDPTNDRNGDGNPLNDDTDNDGIPNYLDPDTTLSRL